MAEYRLNIGAYQTDAPGATYKTNIGADQTDAAGGQVVNLDGVITCTSTVAGSLDVAIPGQVELSCALIGKSTASGEAEVTKGVAWNAACQAVTSGVIRATYKLTGTIGVQSTVPVNDIKVSRKLGGTSAGQTTAAVTDMRIIRKMAGVVVGQSNVLAIVRIAWGFRATVAASSTVAAELAVSPREVFMVGTVTGQSSVIGRLSLPAFFSEIPPAMEKDLIDLYSGGAWLWLCEISIPGYDVIRMARNTEGVIYGGNDFPKGNFDVGQQSFAGDGSIPRVLLRIAQDREKHIESIINATKGGTGGKVKLIRTSEKFLDLAVAELEREFDLLTGESDTEWVMLTLGIPSPLTQRIPLRLYSSKMCAYAILSLFKGPECQYIGLAMNCGGRFEDCRAKENAHHFGGEVGLDPNTVRI